MAVNFNIFQNLGRSLMLPIAVLPIAGLLLRLGQADLFDAPFLAAAGDAIFSNLGFLFAIGVAVGLAQKNDGAAGIGGAICFLVATKGAETLIQVPTDVIAHSPLPAAFAETQFRVQTIAKLGVPIGIFSGAIAGALYNRFHAIKLPSYLAFFGGRRFIPIASGASGVAIAIIIGSSWGLLSDAVNGLSQKIAETGNVGLFFYGVCNRLLLVSGLHHILNNVAWFIVGDYHGVTGDLKRFFANDPSAGSFMAGFFPVMMFGLPAACLAMYRSAEPAQRPLVGGMLFSMALTAALTGVTEPIEFTFLFLAPALYAVHALLTGAAMVLMNAFNVKLGFGFSAGAIDYVLNFNKATHPVELLPIGAIYAALYYAIFRCCIVRFDLKTPGRETSGKEPKADSATIPATHDHGRAFIDALGGENNLISVEACTTRLRLEVVDNQNIDESALKNLGAHGILRPAKNSLQIILGPEADTIAQRIRQQLAAAPGASQFCINAQTTGEFAPSSLVAHPSLQDLVGALGGADNILTMHTCTNRLVVCVSDQTAVSAAQLLECGVRLVTATRPGTYHLLLTPERARSFQPH